MHLLALQTASFKWLIGADDWRADNPGALCGLEEILAEISPIRDFSDTMSLEFREPKLMDPEKHLFAFSVFYLFALFAVLVADRWLA